MTSYASIFLSVSPLKPNDVAIILRSNTGQEAILNNADVLKLQDKGRTQIHGVWLRVNPSLRNSSSPKNNFDRLSIPALLSLALPSATLLGAIVAFFITGVKGWEAVFPSFATVDVVWKLTVWGTLITLVSHEQWYYWYGRSNSSSYHHCPTPTNFQPIVSLEIQIESDVSMNNNENNRNSSNSLSQMMLRSDSKKGINIKTIEANHTGVEVSTSSPASIREPAPTQTATSTQNATTPVTSKDNPPFRFIRAAKGDISAAKQRWNDTLKWREEYGIDKILYEPHPNLALIKENYPHFFHYRGRKNECCYYEKPPKMNLKALRSAGITLDDLLRHYALCCEYMWTKIEPSEEGKSIYVIDLDGIGIRDFAGEVVDFVKKASTFTGAHYPERCGNIFVINVPSWFSIIWNVVRSMVDDVTKEKITILKVGKDAITKALLEKIPIHNIPEEYGGTSIALGLSPEEKEFANYFANLGGDGVGMIIDS